jgi:hypothetical protein
VDKTRLGEAHLFEKTCANGAGELGESVYGLKADFRPAVGEGMSWVAVAMLPPGASTMLRRDSAAGSTSNSTSTSTTPSIWMRRAVRWVAWCADSLRCLTFARLSSGPPWRTNQEERRGAARKRWVRVQEARATTTILGAQGGG